MGTSVAVTDQNGLFRFSTVPIGDYKLTFELAGFGTICARRHPSRHRVHRDRQR